MTMRLAILIAMVFLAAPCNAQLGAGACGVWNWFNGLAVTINADGTQTDSNGGRGTWTVQNDGRVHLHWDSYNSNDILTVSADGNSLAGTYNGRPARSTRRSVCSSSSIPPASNAGACGVWNWFNGLAVTINGDGTQTDSNGGRGTWSVQNDGRVHLHWDSYNSNDILTLSADGNTLSGSYNGRPAQSTRRSPCTSSIPPLSNASACGVWSWFNGFTVTLYANGTQTDSNGGRGTWWVQSDGRVHLHWDTYNSNDILTPSVDGNTLGGSFNGRQAQSSRRGLCPSSRPGTTTLQPPGGGELCLTAKVQSCVEQWISLATSRLNAHNGSRDFNLRKPWSYNRYGIVQGGGGAGPSSAFAPDNFPQYHNNKYCYMMGTYPAAWDSADWRGAGVPILQTYVLSCAGR